MARPELLDALIQQESSGNNNAVSKKGARGLAQIMPRTAKNPGYGVTPLQDNTPGEQRRFANDYLDAMLNEFGGDERLALAAYNAGPGAVKAHKDVPPYPETQSYVKKILSSLNPISDANADETPWSQAKSAQPMPWDTAEAVSEEMPWDKAQIIEEGQPQETPSRIAGLGGRAVLEGVAGVPAGIYNTASTLSHLPSILTGKEIPATNEWGVPSSINTQQYGTKLANYLGLPQATEGERIPMEVARTVSGFAVPLAGIASTGNKLGALGKMMGASNPVSTTLSAGISKGASEIAKERGADPLTQAAIGAGAGMGVGGLMSMAAPAGRTAARAGANVAGQLEGLAGRTLNRQAGAESQTVQQLLEAGVVPGVKPFGRSQYNAAGEFLGPAPGGYQPTSSTIAGNAGISGLARFVENTPQAPVALSSRAFSNAKALKEYVNRAVGSDASALKKETKLREMVTEISRPMRERNLPVNIDNVTESLDRALLKNQGNPAIEGALTAIKEKIPQGDVGFNQAYNFKQYIDDALRGKYDDPASMQIAKSGTALKGVKQELAKSLTEVEPEFAPFLKSQAIGMRQLNQSELAKKLISDASNKTPLVSNASGLQEEVLPLSAAMLKGKTLNKKLMDKLSEPQKKILENASKLASAGTRASMGMARGSNTAQNLKLDEMIAEDVARAFTGSDVSGTGGGLISGILRPATKGLSNVTGRTGQIADILAKAELDPAYAAMLMKKYKLSGPLDMTSAASRNALYGAISNYKQK